MHSIAKWILCGTLAFVPACVAEVRSGRVAYVEASPTVEIETYPYVVYEGAHVYWVDGRWYRRGPRGGWVYYNVEPPGLARQRVYVQSAPRAHPHRRR